MLRRERRARFLVDQRGVLAQRIVDVLENERGVGVEFAYARHNARDVFVCGFGNTVDYRIKPLRGFEHDVVHAHVLQKVVAEYGNVDDVRLLHVQNEPSRAVIAEVVVEQREQILGQVSGNGMVVILEIVPAAEYVRVGVFVSEPERRRSEYALRNGIAQIDDLRLFGGFPVVITGCERRRAACEQHDAQHGRDDLLLHDSPPYHPPLRPRRRGFRPYYTTPRTRIQSSIPGALSFNGSLFRPDVRRGSSVTRSPPDVRRRSVPPRRPAPSPLPSRQPSCRRP